ncbi:MAG TPA: TonB-dependent receptor, partial [Chitinophagaceae bacterium]|nr:TonB-dependent receptor [Chitinophagaceae bacterium]
MNKLLVFLTVLFLLPFTLLAQNRVIKGKVVDESGNPVMGVNISGKGAKKGVQTDKDGNFSITVTGSGSVNLVASSVGFETKIVPVSGDNAGTVQLAKAVITQEDVVVIGYSSIKRKDLTGSVSSVGSKELKDFPLSSAAEALQGKLAGVQLVSSEGAPGADIIVRVRGGGSITQDNSPLYIVDGVQVENALSVLSPQDIQSVDVLKDASTTAIYGARGANGVVIITTKGGRSGKTQITYNGSYGFRQLTDFQDVLSPYDFVLWQYERSRGSIADSTSFAQTYGTTWDTLQNYKNVNAINWQDRVFGRKAKFSTHNIAVSGGNQATTFNLSLTSNQEEGVQIESGFKRKLVNFKIDHRATDKLRIGFTARYLDQEIQGIGTTNSGTRATNRLRHTINYRPFELPRPGFGADDFDEAYYL